MAVLIVARKIGEDDDEVRYLFGLEERFDRTLVIRKAGWDVSVDAGPLDADGGRIAAKIRREWQAKGSFPPHATFAG